MKKYIIVAISAGALIHWQGAIPNTSSDKVSLGKRLFSDPILSRDNTVSCASCHQPAYAFSDTSAVSLGVGYTKGVRNTPSVMNISLLKTFFWDGRAQSLEEQALAPIENPAEMDLPVEEAVRRLKNSESYNEQFRQVFGSGPDRTHLAEALAAFERTLETSDSPFDNWKFSGDSSAVSDAVKKGFIVFNEKGKCVRCHFGADFTTNEFRNIGLFNGKTLNDSGRMIVSGKTEDIGKFKTPGLRNLAVTAPYMHNGMFNTLQQVIEFYNDPGKQVPGAINRDSLLAKPMGLTPQEKSDLEAFLMSLTDKTFK
jgi:cytochrome c peroxidase